MRVAVLYGALEPGAGPDEEDSLVQLATVSEALASLGCQVFSVGLSLDLSQAADRLRELEVDLVFNLVDSVLGRGDLIHLGPSLLDYLDLPYTGGRTEAILATSNKPLAKRTLRAAGLPTPPWLESRDLDRPDPQSLGPVIIKPVWDHGSLGLDEDSVLPDSPPEQIGRVLAERRESRGGQWFAEAFIDGREFNISLLAGLEGPQVLPLAEIEFLGYDESKPRVVGYRAKWEHDSYEFQHTPRRFDFPLADRRLLERLRKLSRDCWEVFQLRGAARVDFRVDPAGQPWVIDVNSNPCLSPDGGFAAAVFRAGLDLTGVVERIVNDTPLGQALPWPQSEPGRLARRRSR